MAVAIARPADLTKERFMTDQRARLIKTAAVASLCTALILLAAKIFAWVLSDSASVLSSLLDSLMDIAASAVNFYAVRYALVPADRDHPFGHTKRSEEQTSELQSRENLLCRL